MANPNPIRPIKTMAEKQAGRHAKKVAKEAVRKSYRMDSPKTARSQERKSEGERKRAEWAKKVKDRDGWECKLWKILTPKEKQYILSEGVYIGEHAPLEAMHIMGAGSNPEAEIRFDVNNGVTGYKVLHRRLDRLTCPVTAVRISRQNRLDWLRAARKGHRDFKILPEVV